MLNSNENKKISYISDVRAERLFRAAEDDFFYLKDSKEAIRKIEKALEYAPCMIKAILMLANISVLEGSLQEALTLYKRAEVVEPGNIKVLAGLANIYEMLNCNEKACDYVTRALNLIGTNYSPITSSLIELKSVILIKLNRYEDAKLLVEHARYSLRSSELRELKASTVAAIKYKENLDKRLKQHKLKLI